MRRLSTDPRTGSTQYLSSGAFNLAPAAPALIAMAERHEAVAIKHREG